MRRWWTAAADAADLVAGRAALWLPGALAWSLTVGWIPLVVAVARPPTVADLTFLGARIYTSGAWPWNALAAGAGVVLLATAAFVLVGLAETALAGAGRRGMSAAGVSRAAAIGFVTAAPTLALLAAAATAFVIVATREFTLPGVGDPLLRSLLRVAPALPVVVLAWGLGGLAHAAALRELITGAGVPAALAAVPRRIQAAGGAAALAALAGVGARLVYLAFATLLLAVLWEPIAERLLVGGIDATVVPLLVGFVAIWLCLVLGGGALHAWTSMTWTRVLGAGGRAVEHARHAHGDPHRP